MLVSNIKIFLKKQKLGINMNVNDMKILKRMKNKGFFIKNYYYLSMKKGFLPQFTPQNKNF